MIGTPTQIAGALDIQLPDDNRIWCPPGFFIENKSELPARVGTVPYWTVGPEAKQFHWCGRHLTKEEIEEFVIPNIPKDFVISATMSDSIRNIPDDDT